MSAWKTYPHRVVLLDGPLRRWWENADPRLPLPPQAASGLGGTTHDGASTLIVAGPVPSLKAIERDTSPLGFPSRCTRPFGR